MPDRSGSRWLLTALAAAVLMAALTALSGRDLMPEEGDGDE